MSTAFMENYDGEYEDAYDDAELYDEAYDDSESAASRARQRRARALAARRRVAARRGGTPPAALPATAPPRAVVSAVKELDLQTQVQQDTLRGALAAQDKKLERANLATVSTLLIGEAFRTFGTPDNAFVRVAITAAPLALLPTSRRPRGVEGVLRHPLVYGALPAFGLALLDNQRRQGASVQTINVIGPTQLAAGREDVFVADVLDARGKPSTVTAGWQSDNPAVADVNATTGRVKAGTAPGVAIISVTAGDVVRRFRLEVVAATGSK